MAKLNTAVRRRNAAATRQAILKSAMRAFARSSFNGVGVREIAADAGVTAMLVNRYFGSKEKLFAEAISASMAEPIILTPQNLAADRVGELIASKLIEITSSGDIPLEGFLMLLHSTADQRTSEIGREQIEKGHQKRLVAALKGRKIPQRAALILAIIAGVQVMRQMIALPALVEASPKTLEKLLAPLFQQLFDDRLQK